MCPHGLAALTGAPPAAGLGWDESLALHVLDRSKNSSCPPAIVYGLSRQVDDFGPKAEGEEKRSVAVQVQ